MSRAMTNVLSGRNDTCDVSLSELEVVAPSFFHNTLHLPVIPDWLRVDRAFAGSMAGTSMLLMGAVLMILTSLHSPESPEVPPLQDPSVVANVSLPEAAPAVDTQAPLAKSRAKLVKRKAHLHAIKAPRRAKVAKRPLKLHKRALAAR